MKNSFLLLTVVGLASSMPGLPTIGRIDTIGGTTYDCSTICAGMQRMVYFDPGYGIHVTWSWSEDTVGSAFPDRNVRYNFYDQVTGVWKWLDTDYMHAGMGVFAGRSCYGALDLDPSGHVITVSRNYLPTGEIRHCAGAGRF
jgi:hypothetical protein